MDGAFKVPELPSSGGSKRKLPSSSSTDTSGAGAKRPRTNNNGSADPLANLSKIPNSSRSTASAGHAGSIPIASGKGKGRAATVEDERDEEGPQDVRMQDEEEDVDGIYGVAEETFEADDGDEEGGRFFGGGTNETQEVSILSLEWEFGQRKPLRSVLTLYSVTPIAKLHV
jgi:hypothetical protein